MDQITYSNTKRINEIIEGHKAQAVSDLYRAFPLFERGFDIAANWSARQSERSFNKAAKLKTILETEGAYEAIRYNLINY